MSKKFYTLERKYRIYALVDTGLRVAFVGKSYAASLASMYSKHCNGKNYLTADFFGNEPPKVKPDLLILQEVHCTGATAYRHIVAWSRYFEERGFLMLTQAGTMEYSQHLQAETQKIYDCISQEKLEDVLMRRHIPTKAVRERKVKVCAPRKATKQKLTLRVDESDKDVFLELKRGLGITQREVFHLLLDEVVLADDKSYIPLIRRQKNQISDLENQLQELKNQLSQERANKKSKRRNSDTINYAKTVIAKYMKQRMQGIAYGGEPMKPTRNPQNDFHNFAYPKESGDMMIQLEEMIYGKGRAVVFVLGWTEDGQAIKLRHYGKKEFLGSDPCHSPYATYKSWWQVHYRLSKDGVPDLMAAFPLTEKIKVDLSSKLDERIGQIGERKS